MQATSSMVEAAEQRDRNGDKRGADACSDATAGGGAKRPKLTCAQCGAAGSTDTFFQCGRCPVEHAAMYCCVECQCTHWPLHALTCRGNLQSRLRRAGVLQ